MKDDDGYFEKIKQMRAFLLLFLLVFTFGCTTKNIKYDRNKILKKYSTDYKISVDNEVIDLETIYLDKDNIEGIRINKRTKEIKITQLKSTELLEITQLNIDNLLAQRGGWNNYNLDLIVINGIPLTDSLKHKTKIDLNAITSIGIITQNKINNSTLGRRFNGDLLVITTK